MSAQMTHRAIIIEDISRANISLDLIELHLSADVMMRFWYLRYFNCEGGCTADTTRQEKTKEKELQHAQLMHAL